MKSRLVARFLLALVLVQSLVVLLSAPVQAKPISSMNLAEQAQSWWYYNALRICLDDAGWNFNNAPGANFNQISQSDVTSGDWFEHGFVGSSNQGTVHGYFMRDALASIGNDGHMRCQDNDGQLVNKALSLWGIDAVDMLCSSTQVLKRYNNQPCDGNNQFVAADGFANRTRLILDYVDDKIGSTPQALSGAARYYYIWQSFKNSCVYENRSAGTVLGAPMNFGDEWTYMIAEPVSGEIKPVKYVGNKKKSDSVYTWPGGSQNTCGWLEGELSWNGSLVTAYADTIAANPDLDPGTDANSAGDTSGAASCNISGVGWIVCPLATFGAKITDLAYAGIEQLMVVKPVSITDFGSTNPIFAIWSSMRNFANIAFIFAFFMIIFSQATSIGLSSYGLKKMLPRLIVAAILVNLSYFICALGVDISNIIGAGIDGIINSAYTAAGPTATGNDFWSGVVGNALAGTGLFAGAASFLAATGGAAGGVGAMAGAAWGMLLPFLVTALFAVITALVVLVGRQALLILLIILSPLAFVAYILPNTESLFTKWRKAFIAMLVFYPLVAVVFSGSKVAAQILRTTAPDGAVMHELVRIMSLGVQFFPLFALPFLLKFSGGLLGRVAGMVNNPNKGPFDKLRKQAEINRDTRLNNARDKANKYLNRKDNPGNFRPGLFNKKKLVAKGVRGFLSRPYDSQLEREALLKSSEERMNESKAGVIHSRSATREDSSGLPIDIQFTNKMAGLKANNKDLEQLMAAVGERELRIQAKLAELKADPAYQQVMQAADAARAAIDAGSTDKAHQRALKDAEKLRSRTLQRASTLVDQADPELQKTIKTRMEKAGPSLDQVNRVMARSELVIDEIEAKDIKAMATLQSNLRMDGAGLKQILNSNVGATVEGMDGRSILVTEAAKAAAGSTMLSQGREVDRVLSAASQLEKKSLRSFLVGQIGSNFTAIKQKQVAFTDEAFQRMIIGGMSTDAFQAQYQLSAVKKAADLNPQLLATQEPVSARAIQAGYELLTSKVPGKQIDVMSPQGAVLFGEDNNRLEREQKKQQLVQKLEKVSLEAINNSSANANMSPDTRTAITLIAQANPQSQSATSSTATSTTTAATTSSATTSTTGAAATSSPATPQPSSAAPTQPIPATAATAATAPIPTTPTAPAGPTTVNVTNYTTYYSQDDLRSFGKPGVASIIASAGGVGKLSDEDLSKIGNATRDQAGLEDIFQSIQDERSQRQASARTASQASPVDPFAASTPPSREDDQGRQTPGSTVDDEKYHDGMQQ